MNKRPWYRFENVATDPTVADLFIFDEIGASFWNDQVVSAMQFRDDLAALPEVVQVLRVHVNSPGGDVFDAVAIANMLRAQSTEKKRTVEMSIEGIAASAATIITSAGDTIRIADNALMMIHDPSGIVMGPATDMRAMAEALDRVRDAIVSTYRWVSSLSAEKLGELMAATTWMNASEALANGFVTEIMAGMKVAATFRPDALGRLGEIPASYRPRVEALAVKIEPAPDPQPENKPASIVADPVAVIRACEQAGFPVLADYLSIPMTDVTAKLGDLKTAKAAAESRATEITALCVTAKVPQMAEGYIRGGMPVAEVRAHLVTVTALMDKVEIDSHLPPDDKPRPKNPIGALVADSYVALNARGGRS